jgi:hypothetical protein
MKIIGRIQIVLSRVGVAGLTLVRVALPMACAGTDFLKGAMIERYKIEEKIHTILSREIKAVRKIVSTYQGSAAQKKMLSELLEYNLNRSK